VDFLPTEYGSKLRHDRDKWGHPIDDFRIPSKNEYCKYCRNFWHRIFECINAHSLKLSAKSEMIKLKNCRIIF